MFARRSSGRRFGLLALLGAAPLSLGACGLLIGLDDHQPFPAEGVDAGADVEERPDAPPDAPEDVVIDAPPDVAIDGCAGILCNMVCVDTLSDVQNCGACGTTCGIGFTCDAGVCGDHIEQISAGSNHACALLHPGQQDLRLGSQPRRAHRPQARRAGRPRQLQRIDVEL